MAAGRPVIAYSVGGATETVIAGETGVFFHDQSWETILDAVLKFDPAAWNPESIRTRAERFGVEQFKERIRRYVEQKYGDFQREREQCRLEVR